MAEPRQSATRETFDVAGARLLIVEARFYADIADALLKGAARAMDEARCQWDRITVPGALEIPAAIAMALDAASARNAPYDGAVALGCVIRGETSHYDIVAGESARALMELAVTRALPLGNGILTVENDAQAFARASPEEMDKGGGAARTALAMIALKRRLKAGGKP